MHVLLCLCRKSQPLDGEGESTTCVPRVQPCTGSKPVATYKDVNTSIVTPIPATSHVPGRMMRTKNYLVLPLHHQHRVVGHKTD